MSHSAHSTEPHCGITISLLRSIADNASEILLLFDFTGTILDVNNHACTILGYDRNELLKLNVRDIDPNVVPQKDHDLLWNKLSPQNTHLLQRTYHCKNRNKIPVRVNLGCMKCEGRTTLFSSALPTTKHAQKDAHQELQLLEARKQELKEANEQLRKEMAERRQAQEATRKFEFIANAAKDSMTLISTDYVYEAANNEYCLAINKKKENIVGWSVPQVWGEDIFTTYIKEHLDNCFEGKEVRYEATFSFHGREPGFYDVNYYPYINEDGKVTHAVVITHDITKRKEAEATLRKFTETLDQRVIRRTAELLKANAEQIKANLALKQSMRALQDAQEQLVLSEKMAALGELVTGVAHEINTPVGIGVTVASLLEEETTETFALYESGKLKRSDLESYMTTAKDSSTTILANLRRAAELIQSFKLVAVDQTVDEQRTFRLKEYINEVLLSLGPKFKHTTHTITVNCPDEIKLYSYPGAYMQIITNLVMNSLIHGFETKEHGVITLDITDKDDVLNISYQDNGKGMSPAQVKKIFDPFYTTKRGRGGTGLGMHIVFNVVKQTLGGKISCTSTQGESTTFSITIPIVRSATEHEQP